MNNILFTVEEENLICAFSTSSRNALVKDLNAALFDHDEPEMLEIIVSALTKVNAMNDDDFSAYAFSPAYDDDESEV